MANAKLTKQVKATTTNQVGEFASVTGTLAEVGVNINGICAWGEENKAYFALITSDNAKAIAALKGRGLEATEEEVVTVMLKDKTGAASDIAKKLKAAGIGLDYVYGTNCGCKDAEAMLVLASKDNAKIVAALNG